MDKLFDILNSKSVAGKGAKCPITLNNIEEIEDFLNDTQDYLLKLHLADGHLLSNTRRSG
jgi:hypothetical protein